MKRRLLDLYCSQGGAKRGYLLAGFDSVTGVDTNPLAGPYYGSNFVNGDALEYLREEGGGFDAVHASPQCHRYSRSTSAIDRSGYPDQIAETREALETLGKPWVIENVEDAWRELRDPIMLCGRQFGLTAVDDDGITLVMDRHRLFESNIPLDNPIHRKHGNEWVGGSYGGARRDKYDAKYGRKGGYVPSIRVQQELLGIDWMTQGGMFLSIPPVYTKFIGKQLLERIA